MAGAWPGGALAGALRDERPEALVMLPDPWRPGALSGALRDERPAAVVTLGWGKRKKRNIVLSITTVGG
jgi:hypothetical protein